MGYRAVYWETRRGLLRSFVGCGTRIPMHSGSCLCGAVKFTVQGQLAAPDACHCQQCRKFSGHFFASTDIPRDHLTMVSQSTLRWHVSSEKVRRGFCGTCGTSLFFDPLDQQVNNWIAVAMGAFDSSTETALAKHIFASEKGDYYEIDDGLPKNDH